MNWLIDRCLYYNTFSFSEGTPISPENPIKPAVTYTLPTLTVDDIVDHKVPWADLIGSVLSAATYTLTVTGTVTTQVINATSSLVMDGTQCVELVPSAMGCLGNVDECGDYGITWRYTVQVNSLKENTYFISTGAEDKDGYGVAALYRFGKFQYIVRSSNGTWFASAEPTRLGAWATISVSWHWRYGLEIYHDDVVVARTTEAKPPSTNLVVPGTPTSLFLGCSASRDSSTYASIVVYECTVYEAQMVILIDTGKLDGKCHEWMLRYDIVNLLVWRYWY